MAKGRKTGGRKPGSKNKERIVIPEVLPPETAESVIAETARALVLTSAPVRTPKAVMLDAMVHFEGLGKGFLARAERLMKTRAGTAKVAEAANEGYKYIVAAVECATKAAPYIHARLLAVESRGDMTEDKAPYVLRAPLVMADSSSWAAAVGAALIEEEALSRASAPSQVPLPHPALSQQPVAPEAPPVPAPAVLAIDQGRISTVMPAGPKVVKPTGTKEWLESIKKAG